MCEYCNGSINKMFDVEMYESINGWVNPPFNEATTYLESLIFEVRNDKGYIRLVDLDDCGCLDHGEKVEVNYCPMCGRKL